METSTPTATIRDENEALIHAYQIEHQFSFPLATVAVFSVCGALGYQCDRVFLDNSYIKKTLVKPPKAGNGRLCWTMGHVLDLMDRLEKLRKWSPGAPRHVGKLTDREFAKQNANLSKTAEDMETWRDLPLTQLMRILVNEDTRERRLCVAAVFLAKLSGELTNLKAVANDES